MQTGWLERALRGRRPARARRAAARAAAVRGGRGRAASLHHGPREARAPPRLRGLGQSLYPAQRSATSARAISPTSRAWHSSPRARAPISSASLRCTRSGTAAAHVSPYAPVSRLYRSELYLDVLRVPELARCPEARRLLARPGFQRELERLRDSPRVEYARVAAAKREILRALHGCFAPAAGAAPAPAPTPPSSRARARRSRTSRPSSRSASGAERASQPGSTGTPGRASCAIRARPPSRASGAQHAREIDFHRFVQFELDRQLGAAAAAARRAGMAIGLYPDLALGSARGGAETWSFPDLFAEGASLGAPPDDFSPEGQDWAIPPLDPIRLREQGFAFFRRLLRAAFAHAGALRIDHVLGLFRLYWIPRGRPASEGAYVRQPARELLAILAQESRAAGRAGDRRGPRHRAAGHAGAARAPRDPLLARPLLRARGGRLPAGAGLVARARSRPRIRTIWCRWPVSPRASISCCAAARARSRASARCGAPSRERAASARALEDRLIAEGLLRGREPSPSELAVAVSGFLSRTPCPLVALSLDDAVGESDPGEPSRCRPRGPPELDPAHVDARSERLPAHPGWRACCAALRPGRRRAPPRALNCGRGRGRLRRASGGP